MHFTGLSISIRSAGLMLIISIPQDTSMILTALQKRSILLILICAITIHMVLDDEYVQEFMWHKTHSS